jgi:aspartyl-tRNA(Asn)/glutamyl-tRNA(Gln) amidotransferase subunit B
MLENDSSAIEIAQKNDWIQDSGDDSIKDLIKEVFSENPSEFERFKAGEKKLMGFLMGQLMKKSKGKADPKSASKLINEMVE